MNAARMASVPERGVIAGVLGRALPGLHPSDTPFGPEMNWTGRWPKSPALGADSACSQGAAPPPAGHVSSCRNMPRGKDVFGLKSQSGM